MDNFKRTIHGYDPEEVKAYNKEKNAEIIRLTKELEESKAKYDELKDNFDKVINNKW